MTVKIARMQSGEDVIADIKEIRESPDATAALAYEFNEAWTVMVRRPAEEMFLQEDSDPVESLKDMQVEFFPWSPMTKGRSVVTLYSVVSLSEPHDNVLNGYQEILEKSKSLYTNAEIDHSQTPPADLLVGEGDGDGRGTEFIT